MIPYLPKQISYRAIIVYLIALVSISLFYYNYSMSMRYIWLGCAWVVGFFVLVSLLSKEWRSIPRIHYIELLFSIALLFRIVWVVFSYYYYTEATGIPFEFETADAIGYHLDAEWMAGETWKTAFGYLFGDIRMISDSGYPLYLTIVYKLFGPNIIIARILKAILSSWTCILIYKIATRTFGEGVGRIAGLMAAIMPNLIIYCGYHLKETEMIFLEVAFLERLDFLFRNKRFNLGGLLLVSLLAGSLFLYRTVLGVVAIFTFATGTLLTSISSMKKSGKRVAIIAWGVICLLSLSGGSIATEVEGYWEERDSNLIDKRAQQTIRGNQWARYATSTVMAPMAFVLPYATMVDVDEQYGQQEKSGGNYIRNFMGIFAFLAIYESIRRKKWRDYIIIGAFVFSYLGVISLSGYSNSERFLLPALPGLIMMWAYGVSTLRKKTFSLLTPWCVVVFIMEFAWAFFKLGSRGLF